MKSSRILAVRCRRNINSLLEEDEPAATLQRDEIGSKHSMPTKSLAKRRFSGS